MSATTAHCERGSCVDDANLLQILQQQFGHANFRPSQLDVVRWTCARHDSLVIMPTGGGKSLCFQLPAVAMPGLAIVVSPLIALMRDQVAKLRELGVQACALNSSLSARERAAVLADLESGAPRTKLLYTSPETLSTDATRALVVALHSKRLVSLLVVDEAHCISTWGHDFRPSYLHLSAVRALLPGVPCMALTATASRPVQEDVSRRLALRDERVFRRSFDRPNIHFSVRYKECVDAFQDLHQLIAALPPRTSAIVYVRKREEAEHVARELQARGAATAAHYHAALSASARNEVQERWAKGEVVVVVATVAFGMGVDKANVRLVVHWNMPKSMEAFYQEAGRAGRDGERSRSVLYYDRQDDAQLTFLAQREDTTAAAKQAAHASSAAAPAGAQRHVSALAVVRRLCTRAACRRAMVLEHFGEQLLPGGCRRGCDFCEDPAAVQRALRDMQAVQRISHRMRLPLPRAPAPKADAAARSLYASDHDSDGGGNVHHAQAQSAPRIVAIPASASLSTALEMLERAEQRQSQRQRERADAGDSRGRKRARVAANASSDDDSGGGRQPWQQLRALKPAASTDASSGGLSGSSRSMVLRTLSKLLARNVEAARGRDGVAASTDPSHPLSRDVCHASVFLEDLCVKKASDREGFMRAAKKAAAKIREATERGELAAALTVCKKRRHEAK